MKRPLFGPAEIDAWTAALDDRPAPITELEWPGFPQVDAFRGGALTAGVALKLRAADGAELSLRLNPVAARELAHWLMHAGQQAGWLDARYNIISPLADHDA